MIILAHYCRSSKYCDLWKLTEILYKIIPNRTDDDSNWYHLKTKHKQLIQHHSKVYNMIRIIIKKLGINFPGSLRIASWDSLSDDHRQVWAQIPTKIKEEIMKMIPRRFRYEPEGDYSPSEEDESSSDVEEQDDLIEEEEDRDSEHDVAMIDSSDEDEDADYEN